MITKSGFEFIWFCREPAGRTGGFRGTLKNYQHSINNIQQSSVFYMNLVLNTEINTEIQNKEL